MKGNTGPCAVRAFVLAMPNVDFLTRLREVTVSQESSLPEVCTSFVRV
jgi:hypothetical protein